MTHRSPEQHLQPEEISAYVDGTAAQVARARTQAHLAHCAECRAEVVDVAQIVRTAPSTARARLWIPAAAAAAVLALLWGGPQSLREPVVSEHRDEAVTTAIAPRAVAPVGATDSVRSLLWSAVPSASRYTVRVFDSTGTVIWQGETTDTVARFPGSVSLRAGAPYYWKVEVLTGFGRSAASDLVEFVVGRGGRR